MDEINKLFSLMGVDLDAMMSAMLEEMRKNMKEECPDIPDSFMDEFSKDLDKEDLRDIQTTIYKRHFTQEDIAGLIKFYESPLCHKLAIFNSEFTRESQDATTAYYESLTTEIIKELAEEGFLS